MYQVPSQPKIQRSWPILLICFYYICAGLYAIIGSIGFILAMIETNLLGGSHTFFLLVLGLYLLINMSRLVLFIGLLKRWRWTYYAMLTVESLMLTNFVRKALINISSLTLISMLIGLCAMLIIGYLLQPKIKHQFLRSA